MFIAVEWSYYRTSSWGIMQSLEGDSRKGEFNMKVLDYSILSITDAGSVFIEESKHDGVTFSFPSDPIFAKYRDQLMVVVEVKMDASKFSLTKSKLDLTSVRLHGVKIVDNKPFDDSVALWAFESKTLGKTMRVISGSEGSKIPAKRDADYVVPAIVNTIELASKEENVGRFIFQLPGEWFVLSQISMGQDIAKIRRENARLDLKSFSTEIIVAELKKHRVFTENLWNLYALYKELDKFETENSELTESVEEELTVSDLDLEETIPESVDLYLDGDEKTTVSLHKQVLVQSSIEKIGTFSKKKAVVLRIRNNSDLGTVKEVHFSFRLLDPVGKELYLAEHDLKDLNVGPGEAQKRDFMDFPEFTDQQLERVDVKLLKILWSNSVETFTE